MARLTVALISAYAQKKGGTNASVAYVKMWEKNKIHLNICRKLLIKSTATFISRPKINHETVYKYDTETKLKQQGDGK